MKIANELACFMPKPYGTVTVGSKGQIVIPQEVRKIVDIKEGDQLLVMLKHGKAIGLIKATDLSDMIRMMQKEMADVKKSKNRL